MNKFKNAWLRKSWAYGSEIWSQEALLTMMKHHTVHGVVHKTCGAPFSVESVRMSQIMSAGPNVIVSELAAKEDLADFAGALGVRASALVLTVVICDRYCDLRCRILC